MAYQKRKASDIVKMQEFYDAGHTTEDLNVEFGSGSLKWAYLNGLKARHTDTFRVEPYSRKKHDALRVKMQYAEFKNRRVSVMELLGGKCHLCGTAAEKGFHLHHVRYDPIESEYPRHCKNMWAREKRLSEAENHPERFALLCPKCHHNVEMIKIIASHIVERSSNFTVEKLKQIVGGDFDVLMSYFEECKIRAQCASGVG